MPNAGPSRDPASHAAASGMTPPVRPARPRRAATRRVALLAPVALLGVLALVRMAPATSAPPPTPTPLWGSMDLNAMGPEARANLLAEQRAREVAAAKGPPAPKNPNYTLPPMPTSILATPGPTLGAGNLVDPPPPYNLAKVLAMTGGWAGRVPGKVVGVVVGSLRSDRSQGFAIWIAVDDATERHTFKEFRATADSGPLTIINADGYVVRLKAESGATYLLDTLAGTFLPAEE